MKKYFYVPERPKSLDDIEEMTEAQVLRYTSKASIDEVLNSTDCVCSCICFTEEEAIAICESRM